MSVYKQFTAQDFTITPFNAHKQYNFGSSSADENKITYYSTQWTSESISLYSSASTNPHGLLDPINAVKYSQLDHLLYNNFKFEAFDRYLGSFNYAKHKRELYEKATIISIPSGLYGQEIKPGSFYLSASYKEVVDDTYGNLIISGTNIDNYPTNINRNTFRLDPIDGFRKYDLNVFTGYANPQNLPPGYRKHWRKGDKKPNMTTFFSNPDEKWIHDDSYYFNKLKFNNVKYQTSSLGHPSHRFPIINLNSTTGSYIASPHNPQYNFNRDDDFSISFWIEPQGFNEQTPSSEIGDELGGGIVFHKTTNYAYVVYPSLYYTHTTYADFVGIAPGLGNSDNTIGGGEANTTTLANYNTNGKNFPLAQEIKNLTLAGHNDWWMANQDESFEILRKLGNDNENPFYRSLLGNNYIDLGVLGNPGVLDDQGRAQNDNQSTSPNSPFYLISPEINLSRFDQFGRQMLKAFQPKLDENGNCTGTTSTGNQFTNCATTSDPIDGCCAAGEDTALISAYPVRKVLTFNQTGTNGSIDQTTGMDEVGTHIALLVRKVAFNSIAGTIEGVNDAPNKRYIIAKSGTKTIIPTSMQGQSGTFNTNVSGNLQPLNVSSEAQFPYEIYNKGTQLHFDRSDGRTIASVSASITASNGSMLKNSHIVCVNSASIMQIWHDGVKVNELDSTTILKGIKTQNKANLYIGSKGKLSQNDGLGNNILNNSINKFFNGNIGYINIFDHHLESSSIVPMSESINNSPYIGNMFYQNGLATITHPKHYDILANPSYGIDNMVVGENGNFIVSGDGYLNKIKFQGTHLIYEHEYQCTAEEHEFNVPSNITARKNQIENNNTLEDFTTSSAFAPYVTTVGLYNDVGDLLVVGKLGQPIRMSNETDTTFVLRWDT